ncbi:uncharacterized protein LOC129243148 isoform X1 [Anastrepha obliqua]|uniref:uncharacterized protein LOC129243148 isoform X1 n=2 Tax=Anastrepha obliqua TaxID=95512 RepID=UPI00240A7084|nr:uncharacterized protein LOC129243148 isoform X1 [Anastrepha obliqua]
MVENYFSNGSTRRSFQGARRGFDCRPQRKPSPMRNNCNGPSTSAAAAAALNYESCCCPQKIRPPTSLSRARFSSSTMPKMHTNNLHTGAGMISSARQSTYTMARSRCEPSAASLVQDSCSNLNTVSNISCCCCPHCGKPQDPAQAPMTSPCRSSPPKQSLPCRAKPQPRKEEKPSPETEIKCRMRKLQLENLVKDQYCPGAIQSTIDCEEDFNEMSFRLVFGCAPVPCTRPTVEPISLMEALCMRVELERCLVNNKAAYVAESRRGSRQSSSETDEVNEFFSKKYKTALNEALASFLKAERCYSAENPDENSLTMDAHINKTSTCLPSSSFKITAYTGNTRPTM